ncbi:hypothetical protein [Kingella oralis]|uniref:Uncharacterized protein n=1 Tax=Kingella oralis ATCC 51147 TaxID=629741 RepID=C4GFP6_9NEIS|nr:hypothetical protein [Kingella oralis]EEP69051.1 hypothetical protein GCWU000324_00962 [Kingella oralis ATCC 51147]QMT41821.1 hypothetical protein H3L93_07090 [Kingella oralis]
MFNQPFDGEPPPFHFRFQAAFGVLQRFQAALLRRVMRLTFSGCLIFHRQPETRLGDAKTVYAILR